MNDKTSHLVGVPVDVRIMHTKLVPKLEGLGKGKFKPSLSEPRKNKMDSLYLAGEMKKNDSFFLFFFSMLFFTS